MSKQTKDLVAAAHLAFAMDEISLKQLAILSSAALHKKSLHIGFLCVSVVCFARNSSTTETQRTQILHREEGFVTFCGKPSSAVVFRLISRPQCWFRDQTPGANHRATLPT